MMLVLLLCVIMKIAELSVGRTSPQLPVPTGPPFSYCNKPRRFLHRNYHRNSGDNCRCPRKKCAGKGTTVTEDPQTPGSDCNSNPATDSIPQDLINSEFIQDNVEYQWFIDYGYRDGGLQVHPSVLSSLSASYSRDDLGYYDDLSRNLDANLAEIDMESFRTADIHTLLTTLPVMCTNPIQNSEFNYQRERYASISGSVMEKLDIGSSMSPHTSSQGEDSACSTTDTISICKSSLLFSPLKEAPVLPVGGSYSVDSLDCEDMLLTCQANNKNNYTIAFEGSMTMYSDGSQDFENQEKQQRAFEAAEAYYTSNKIDLKNMYDLSMACSDSKIYTTWSNLKHCSVNKAMSRHPSGNNNTIPNLLQTSENNFMINATRRSQSLPDLRKSLEFLHQGVNGPLNFSIDSAESHNHAQQMHSSGSMSRSITEDSSDGGAGNHSTGKKLQNLSLVRLFMKQKSMSAEGMSLTLDQSDSNSEGGWPSNHSGSCASTSNTNTNANVQIHKQNVSPCNRRRSTENNDFSINWIRTDCCNRDAENPREVFNSIPKYSLVREDEKTGTSASVSVDQLSSDNASNSVENVTCLEKEANDLPKRNAEIHSRSVWTLDSNKYPIYTKTMGVQAMTQVEDNGVQTSLIYDVSADKTARPSFRETIVNQRPVYVVYPNYTLPDLSFLNVNQSKLDNVALKPQSFDKNKVNWKKPSANRPFSCNDIDALKQRGFSHVKDWESLTFLLPLEYKKILHHVPEIPKHINCNEEIKKPLFCLSPPLRQRKRTTTEYLPNNSSSTSSTATQPSSGYRGSSTILTDSSSTNQQAMSNNLINPLYPYRYDCGASSEASVVGNERHGHRTLEQTKAGPRLPKRSISLPYAEKETDCLGRVPPRPPLPRSILRKTRLSANKRYSMFEMGGVKEVDDQIETNKRMSLQEPYYINNDVHPLCNGKIIDSEKDIDETEERLNEAAAINETEADFSGHNEDDVKQLEDFLKRSGLSSQSSDGDNEDPDVKLRSYVKKFLSLRMNKEIVKNIDMVDPQKKTVSFAMNQRRRYLDDKTNNANLPIPEPVRDRSYMEKGPEVDRENKAVNLEAKRKMVLSVNRAVDLLMKYWNSEPTNGWTDYDEKDECAQLCLTNLCPALYSIMSDGLKPNISSAFGPITNSVWQVVEASSQQGPLTKTLNELVQKINGEDVMTEGMLKFHAFVFGLLNLRALDAWFAYLCTRESILRKHYKGNSLFVSALANANTREIMDNLLYILNPLAFHPFQIDLLYQYRQLHNSFGNMNNHIANAVNFRNMEHLSNESHLDKMETCATTSSPKKIRPRSSISYNNYDDQINSYKCDVESAVKRRLSTPLGIINGFHTLERIAFDDSEDYTDSLEHSPLNRANKPPINAPGKTNTKSKTDEDDTVCGEIKFRRLQEKWEQMVNKDEAKDTAVPSSPTRTPAALVKSKIPRPLTSPVKQPTLLSANTKTKSPISGIPALKKSPVPSTAKVTPKKPIDLRGKDVVTRRTSRVDQETTGVPRSHLARPSSLPYKTHTLISKDKNLISPQRRAASTSLPRPTSTITPRNTPTKNKLNSIITSCAYRFQRGPYTIASSSLR
ncbi:uncharacterized protein [Prorops nasuta]|uniref:uncharacterized protein isoform X3 n=1 Tax=Prorops nasuta TaxID=863751 RepID=UPI0034CFB9F5